MDPLTSKALNDKLWDVMSEVFNGQQVERMESMRNTYKQVVSDLAELLILEACTPGQVFAERKREILCIWNLDSNLVEFSQALEQIPESSFCVAWRRAHISVIDESAHELPKSARKYTKVDPNGEAVEVPDFIIEYMAATKESSLWNSRITALETLLEEGKTLDEVLEKMPLKFGWLLYHLSRDIALYQKQIFEMAPQYRRAMDVIRSFPLLNSADPNFQIVVHGRDTRAFYEALRASGFPATQSHPIIYLISSKGICEDPLFAEYVRQLGITTNSYHIDVGWFGSAPEKVLYAAAQILGEQEYVGDELDRRIKLFWTQISNRTLLGIPGQPGEANFFLPHDETQFTYAPCKFDTLPDGTLVPHLEFIGERERISYFVYLRSIQREFEPK